MKTSEPWFSSKVFERVRKFADGCGGCIPESFVGHYRVKHDPGLHCPVNSWDALTAAPFRSAPPHCAEKTWPKFFIAVQISSHDSVSFRPSFSSESRSWLCSRWRGRPI